MDRNGYNPSILMDDENFCYLCGSCDEKLDRHEVFGGAFRNKSKRLGLWVSLCHNRCHIYGDYAVHNNATIAKMLKAEAQNAAMSYYGWTVDDFRQEFGKNYE